MTTVRLKLRPASDECLTQSQLRALFGEFGIIDGVTVDKDGRKAFIMFRHRDSALRVINAKEAEGLKEFKMKLVSTSKAQEREERQKKRFMITDPIEKLKSRFLLVESSRELFMKPLEELEEEVFQKIRDRKRVAL